ncbi:Dynein intermediate chain [Nesidiocoris tenuis]|uniref:Dynein axonemal intermediate chain 4 n=1 Tax=Nesidiocoris tenuis TaxID=355587 RepID=A0ABN7AY25_9HEMI|nr:Dynein intermediate chain [Nesidiocoris tenuis]
MNTISISGKVFKYTLRILWKTKEPGTGGVNNISTLVLNRNLIAVGYGDRGKDGTICVWNSKNPRTPEKKIMLQHAVTSTSFSKENPHWLAAVTEAGDVLIVDVGPSVTNVMKNPYWDVAWFLHNNLEQVKENVVTVGDSGQVLLWDPHVCSSNEIGNLVYSKIPHDNMFIHKHGSNSLMRREKNFMQSKFQAAAIDLDPIDPKTIYVSTTQGSLLVCTTSKILGPPSPFPAHRGAVLGVKHSPALPLVYLTHGSDAKTFIWVHGVKPPIASLTTDSLDPVLCALWSPSHCSVILTLNRKTICIWDIRRSDLDPMTILFAEEGIHFCTADFNQSGTVVFVGCSDGTVTAYNLHEMPHLPYLQKNHLLAAFKKILWRNKTLYDEVSFVLNR